MKDGIKRIVGIIIGWKKYFSKLLDNLQSIITDEYGYLLPKQLQTRKIIAIWILFTGLVGLFSSNNEYINNHAAFQGKVKDLSLVWDEINRYIPVS